MKRLALILIATIAVICAANARGGFVRALKYKHYLIGATAKNANKIDKNGDHPYYDGSVDTLSSMSDKERQEKAVFETYSMRESDDIVMMITAIAILILLCVGSIFVVSLLEKNRPKETACRCESVSAPISMQGRSVLLANGKGIMVLKY